MRFKIEIVASDIKRVILPIKYQYTLSAVIYKILAKGDAEYFCFLHVERYGRGV